MIFEGENNMSTLDLIINSSKKFYECLNNDENGRCRSWEHCYSHFMKYRGQKDVDYDYLSLHLAFYLASWGMYRGSSFLLQKDYKVHIPVVKELLIKKYDDLAGIDYVRFKEKSNQKLLMEIYSYLENYYNKIRKGVKEKEYKNKVSSTLITKILMGTLGCVPAYDRYFIEGIKKYNEENEEHNMIIRSFGIKSIMRIIDFYDKYHEQLEDVRKSMIVEDMLYPQIKIIDMGFWQLGFESDTKK